MHIVIFKLLLKKKKTYLLSKKGIDHYFSLQFDSEIASLSPKDFVIKISKILGYDEKKEKEYIQSVIKADFEEVGDEDVFRKIKADLKDHNISDEEIRKKMDELNEKAKSDFK